METCCTPNDGHFVCLCHTDVISSTSGVEALYLVSVVIRCRACSNC